MLKRIVDGRTDMVFEYLAEGHPANSVDGDGVSLIKWCAYYGDVSAVRFLLANGESLKSRGDNLGLNGAAFHGYWRLCQFLIESPRITRIFTNGIGGVVASEHMILLEMILPRQYRTGMGTICADRPQRVTEDHIKAGAPAAGAALSRPGGAGSFRRLGTPCASRA